MEPWNIKIEVDQNPQRSQILDPAQIKIEVIDEAQKFKAVTKVEHPEKEGTALANNLDAGHLNCPICKARFKLQQSLDCHIEITHKEHKKPHACSICGKRFLKEIHMTCHQRLHKNEAYSCGHCSKKFYKSVQLKRHVKSVHTAKEKIPCTLCTKSFLRKSDLNRHMLHTHTTGPKPTASLKRTKRLECEKCDKKFHQRKSLLNHMIVHTNDKPFKCTECLASFMSKRSLEYHSEEHKMNYLCPNCKAMLRTKEELTGHERLECQLTNMSN